MRGLLTPPPAIVIEAEATEQQLVDRAREADSDAAWIIGECASLWTQQYAKGRTDADFARLIGTSREQVAQRRLVYEAFADVRKCYLGNTFSHFRAALNWDDAAECLAWADESEATVAQMKAWRRMQHGEDLTVDPDDEDEWQADAQAEGHEDAAPAEIAPSGAISEEHVADVDPHQRPPSHVKNTPREEEYDPTEPAESEQKTVPERSRNSSETPQSSIEQRHFTLDELRKLIVAAEDTSGDVREIRMLAAWHRQRADELDPPPNSPVVPMEPSEPTVSVAQASVIVEEWNLITGVSRCKLVTEKRRRKIATRMKKKFWRENWRKAMQKVARSPFCRGCSKSGWIADIDWFIRDDDTVVRLLEGAYDDSDKASQMMDTLREWAAEDD